MKTILLYIALFFIISCSTTDYRRMNNFHIEQALTHKEYDNILSELDKRMTEVDPEDKMVLFLNKAIILHYSKKYKESNDVLEKIKYETYRHYGLSLKSLLKKGVLNDESIPYTLDPHEEIFVFNLMAINYSLMNKLNDSLIEYRALDPIYNTYLDNKIISNDNFYSSYLSGLFYELNNKKSDSLIDYNRVFNMNPNFDYIGYDLVRLNYRTNKFNEMNQKIMEYKINENYLQQLKDDKRDTQLVLYFMNGLGPYKIENENYPNVPKYMSRLSHIENASIFIDGEFYGHTLSFGNLDKIATEFLQKNHKQMVVNDMTRLVSQELVSLPVDILSGGAGIASRTLLHLNSKANFRYWTYMPKEVQIAKISLNPGKHHIKLVYYNGESEEQDVLITKDQTTFSSFSYHD